MKHQNLVEFYPDKFDFGETLLTGIVMDDNYGFIHVTHLNKWFLIKDFGDNGEHVMDAFLKDDYSKFEESDNITALGNMYSHHNIYHKLFNINRCYTGIKDLDDHFLYCTLTITHGKNKESITNFTFVHGLLTEDQFAELNKIKKFKATDFVTIDRHPIQRILEIKVDPWR